jgi:hypothetical protein
MLSIERMSVKFEPGGPKRFKHQIVGLKKLIDTGGVGALLFEPGLGKTGTTLDFAAILALKQPEIDGVQEARMLVIAPLAAVDTWVKQAAIFVSPQVNYWAEAIGGSILQRAETLAARGGQSFPFWNPKKPPVWLKCLVVKIENKEWGMVPGFQLVCKRCEKDFLVEGAGPRAEDRALRAHLTEFHKDYSIRLPLQKRNINGVYMETPKRAEGWQRSWDWGGRASEGRTLRRSDGPDGLGKDKPRLIIEVVNIDTLGSRQARGSKSIADIVLEGVKRYNPHLVVVDESHKIKGATSNVSRMADRIGQCVSRRIILTGTVMPAGPLDVFGQWRFLDPYAFGLLDEETGARRRATFSQFEAQYAVMGGYLGHQVIGYRNMDLLQDVMSQRAVVALKKDALDLPPVIEIVVPVMLSFTEKRAYNEMKKNLAMTFGNGAVATVANRLVQMMRLRQITSGHLPDDMGIVRELGTSKADTIASIVHDTLAGKKRIVVFCLFTHELEVLRRRLQRQGTVVETISGATSQDARVQIRRRFGDKSIEDRIVLIAQVKTLSLAVNELVTAQDVIFGSLSSQRDDLIQAIDRLNRIGQEGEKVNVWYAEAPGTIDEVIHKSHQDRTDLEASVLSHVLDANPLWSEGDETA